MWPFALKVAVTTTIIVAVSEIAKRSSFWAAALASLPLTSLLALIMVLRRNRRHTKGCRAFARNFLAGHPIAAAVRPAPLALACRLEFLGQPRHRLDGYCRSIFRHGVDIGTASHQFIAGGPRRASYALRGLRLLRCAEYKVSQVNSDPCPFD